MKVMAGLKKLPRWQSLDGPEDHLSTDLPAMAAGILSFSVALSSKDQQ